jgi:hypothetical protein
MEIRRALIIRSKKKNIYTDRCSNIIGQECDEERKQKDTKIQEFIYRDTTNMEHEYMIIPVVIGATGIVPKVLKRNLKVIPKKNSIDSLQKTAILGTSHII